MPHTENAYSIPTTWFRNRIRYNFSEYKWARKFLGGYWENWIIEILHGEIWIQVKKTEAYDTHYRPGCGRGTPYCEYYPIEYFDSKLYFNEDKKKQILREQKLKRLCK